MKNKICKIISIVICFMLSVGCFIVNYNKVKTVNASELTLQEKLVIFTNSDSKDINGSTIDYDIMLRKVWYNGYAGGGGTGGYGGIGGDAFLGTDGENGTTGNDGINGSSGNY